VDTPESLGAAPAPRGPSFFARPWFWLLFVGTLFSIPLIKGLGAEFPEPLPGLDRAPSQFALLSEDGTTVQLSDLAGYLVVATELPLANGVARQDAMTRMRALRKRLRGLGSSVVFVMLCHGAGAPELTALLDEWSARKPVNVFLLDSDRDAMADLRHEGGSESAEWFLLDRHGRIRGVYGVPAAADPSDERAHTQRLVALEAEMDRLIIDAGQLANWADSDTPPGPP
jgi:hypothetical protein